MKSMLVNPIALGVLLAAFTLITAVLYIALTRAQTRNMLLEAYLRDLARRVFAPDADAQLVLRTLRRALADIGFAHRKDGGKP